MKVIKNINNNVSVCIDSNGQEVIAFGRGIGFVKPPYELEVAKIQRTFYDIDSNYVQMINYLPNEIIELSAEIVDFARMRLQTLHSSNIVFTLADHINFAIQRYKDGLRVNMPIYYDIKHMYPDEFDIGVYAMELIKDRTNVDLPKEEIVGIATHIVNAEGLDKNENSIANNMKIIEEITEIIEDRFHLQIEKESFNYSRFVSHMQYLLKRGSEGKSITTKNDLIYESLKETFPDIDECAKNINRYILKELGYKFEEEEILYLMLHINRLCAREDCYQ